MIGSRRLYPLRSSSLAIRGWSLRKSPSAASTAPLLALSTLTSKLPETPVPVPEALRSAEPYQRSNPRRRKNEPREFDKMPRSEHEIRQDLAQQLEEIYSKQARRWTCPL